MYPDRREAATHSSLVNYRWPNYAQSFWLDIRALFKNTESVTCLLLVALLTVPHVHPQLIIRNNHLSPGSNNARLGPSARHHTEHKYPRQRLVEHEQRSQVPVSSGAELVGRAARSQSALSLRGARNASSLQGPLGSWHFPRISPEQAAEVIITGAQVINRIAQAETPLNYCKTPDNQEGECSDIRKCIWLVLDTARLKQSVCLRNFIIPAVCCPTSNNSNTPIANMIQSTLEPVLFRPKAPKQKKPAQGSQLMRPFESILNKTIIGLPPPSPASLIIRSPTTSSAGQSVNSSAPAPTSSSSTTPPVTSTSTYTTSAALSTSAALDDFKSTSAAPTLFQSHDQAPPAPTYNRTLSQKYPWANGTCGDSGKTRTSRIVGGSDSKLGQWPWMTAMYLKRPRGFSSSMVSEFWCGGALINRRFVLTAAHCLSDQKGNRYKTDQVTIKLGGVDLVRHQAPPDIVRNAALSLDSRTPNLNSNSNQLRSRLASVVQARDDDEEFSWTSFITKALGFGSSSPSSGSTSSPVTGEPANKALNQLVSDSKKQQLAARAKKTYFKEYRVANIKQHPDFQRRGFYNDIGLIELKSDVDYDDLIAPICLPSEFDLKRDLSGYMATVLGWGTLSYQGQGSKLLQQVSLPIWNNKDCDARYPQDISKTFICAGFLTGGKDACQGDSGGPLMVSDKSGRWTIHGVVSFGKMCAQPEFPGVYTRITEYLDWIRDNTDPTGY